MNVIGERFHVGKLGVRGDVPLRVALSGFPRIVDVHVDIARVLHPARDHCIGDLPHRCVVDLTGKFVPAVPSHGRCAHQSVVSHIMQLRQRQTRRRQSRFRLRAFGGPLHWLSSRSLRGHLNLVALHSSLVSRLAHLVAGAGSGDKVQLAIFERSLCDGDLSRASEHLAGDILAILLDVKKSLAKIAVACWYTKDPETGEIRLSEQRICEAQQNGEP